MKMKFRTFLCFSVVAGCLGFCTGILIFSKRNFQPQEPPLRVRREGPVQESLREADPGKSLKLLEELALKNPKAFFKQLEHFPSIDGVHELILVAASKLSDKDAAECLNSVRSLTERKDAWISYLTNIKDSSLVQKIEIARLAKPESEEIIFKGIVMPGLRSDPEVLLESLKKAGQVGPYTWGLGELAKDKPGLVVEQINQALKDRSLAPDACQLVLETAAINNPSTDFLKSISNLISTNSHIDGIYAEPIFGSAFNSAEGDKKLDILNIIAELPSFQKNAVLSQIPLSECPNVESAAKVINSLDSYVLQKQAVDEWKKSGASQSDLDKILPLLEGHRIQGDFTAAAPLDKGK